MRPGLRGLAGILALTLGFVLLGACDDDGPSRPGRVCGGIAAALPLHALEVMLR